MWLLFGIFMALSVIIPTIIGAVWGKEEPSRTITIGIIIGIIYGGIVWFATWISIQGVYGPTPLFGGFFLGLIIGCIIVWLSEEVFIPSLPGFIPAMILIIMIFSNGIKSCGCVRTSDKAKLLQIEEKAVIDSKTLKLADPEHICLVDEDVAKSKAEKALGQIKTSDGANAGSRYKLERGTKQFVDEQLWWVFPIEFDGYWKWSDHKEVPGFIRVSAENPYAEAQAVQQTKDGKHISIKYLNSACFENNAERYLRNNGYLTANIQDFTFEVDDNWCPYYTVSKIEWTIGYGGDILKSVIILNLQTGGIEEVALNQIKNKYPWLDRAFSLDVLDYQAGLWGEYSKADWAWTSSLDGQRQKPTPGWYLVYDEDKCYWFTGWTSYSSSSDLIGVSLSDGVTGKTTYYKTSGSTEDVAEGIAKSHWSNFAGYNPSSLSVYNIYGMLTYVIPIVYDGTQFKGVSLVSVINKDINAKGDNLEQALNNYKVAMFSTSTNSTMPYEGQPKKLTISGNIENVGMPVGNTFSFMIKDVKKIFQVNYSLVNAKVCFIKPGIMVKVGYMDTKDKVISCESFDIPEIILTEDNPTQAKYITNQKVVKEEEKRINNIQENSAILENEDLSKVNPVDLKNFIESQKKSKK